MEMRAFCSKLQRYQSIYRSEVATYLGTPMKCLAEGGEGSGILDRRQERQEADA